MIADRTIGAVMAGGESSRMLSAKSLSELGGKPLIEYPLAALSEAGIDAVVVAKRHSPLPQLDVPVWLEPDRPSHPLVGIVTALERAGGGALIVCGCDMPFIATGLLSFLAGCPEPLVVPRAADRLHPLLARYDTSLIAKLRPAIRSSDPLQATIADLDPTVIDEIDLRRFGDPERLLFNVNTPADLERAEELL